MFIPTKIYNWNMEHKKWQQKDLVEFANSDQFKKCEISKVFADTLINDCISYGLVKEISIIKSRVISRATIPWNNSETKIRIDH